MAILLVCAVKIGYYPGKPEEDPVDASTRKWIEKLKRKKPDLYSIAMKVLKKMEESDSLQPFIDQGIVAQLSNPLWEIKIPKKKAGGVVRLYFCKVPHREGYIHILEHEIKNGRTNPDSNILKSARKRYKELFR